MSDSAPPEVAFESGLIVPVPEAETAVADLRLELDTSAPWGVPAHITVLYPFMPPDLISDRTLMKLEDTFRKVNPFEFELTGTAWFERDVLYLTPFPDSPFRLLTASVSASWPMYLPYDGEHGEPTPHLTIGDTDDPRAMRAAEQVLQRRLPISAVATEVWLMTGSQESGWSKQHRFRLGSGGT